MSVVDSSLLFRCSPLASTFSFFQFATIRLNVIFAYVHVGNCFFAAMKRLIPISLLLLLLLLPTVALAHPMGQFSVSRYSRLTVQPDQVDVFYVVDMGEVPTFQARNEIDVNGDGDI